MHSSHVFDQRSAFRQRGAAVAEYLPPLIFGVLLTMGAWQGYGDVVRKHMAQASQKFSEYYYQGWFWPEDTPPTTSPWGAPSNGREGGDTPQNSGGGTGGNPQGNPSNNDDTGTGNAGNDTEGSNSDGGGAGNNSGGTGNTSPDNSNDNSGLGSNLTPGGGGSSSGDAPMTCDGGASATETSTSAAPVASNALASNASTFTSVGNPIDIGTGNKFQKEDDFTNSNTGNDALSFSRYYNSVLADQDSGVGYGWRHSYQRALVIDEKNSTVTVWRDDGSQYLFKFEANGIVAPNGIIDSLAREREGWSYSTGAGDREFYDKQGQLQRIMYAAGNIQSFSYDEQQHLSRVENSEGVALTLRWQANHLQSIELSPSARTIHYRYSDTFNLIGIRELVHWYDALSTLFEAPTRAYRYEDKRHPHALTGLDNALGERFATWTYDNAGRAISSEHGNGVQKVSITYRVSNAHQHEVIVTNAAGLTATYVLEPARAGKYRLREVEGKALFDCPAIQNHHRYDSNGFLLKQWNAENIGNVFKRNTRGLVEVEERGMRFDKNENPRPELGSTRLEREWADNHAWIKRETRSAWVLDENIRKNVGSKQGHWQPVTRRELAYDERGRVQNDVLIDLTERELPYQTHNQRRERHYSYEFADASRLKLRKMHVMDGNRNETTYRYDSHGRVASIENALHQLTRFGDYNDAGLAQIIQLPNGQRLQVIYNAQQLPIKLIRQASDNEKEITQAEYDKAGQLIHLTRADGSELHYSYNSAGQLTQLKNNWKETRSITPNALNGQWEEQRIYSADNELTVRQQQRLNALGQLSAVLGVAGEQTELQYNAQGDLIRASERDQNPANTDVAHTTQAKYDTQHHLLELIDAAGYTTHYDYSPSGHIESITDANNNTTETIRNGFGDVIVQSSPVTGSVIKRYDGNGNLIANQSAGGEIQFEYDALNRLTKVDYPGEQNDIVYRYDQTDSEHGHGIQQRTRIDTATQIIDYRYDNAGRKIAETTREKNKVGQFELSSTLQYHYLPGNRLDKITYPDGSAVHYRFDKDRIVEVTYSDAKNATEKTIAKNIQYTPFGGPIAWTYGNGLKQEKVIDQGGKLKSLALKQNDNAIWSQQYRYDLYKNIEQIVGVEQNQATATKAFAYDAVNRITQEKAEGINKRYDYDALGNRVSTEDATQNRQTKNSRYGKGNQLLVSGDTRLLQAHGNTLIEKNNVDTRFTYYDTNNRQRALYENRRLKVTYGYDARGWRNRKTIQLDKTQSPVTQRFTYGSEGRLLNETTSAGNEKNYVWLGNLPLAQIEKSHAANKNSTTHIVYLHADHLNAPRIATDDSKNIVWRWNGDAFGNGKPEEDPDNNGQRTQINLRFPGQYADVESSLFYNIHRYYDPEKGRYTQSDPLGLADGNNSFAYVQNNPLRGTDPLGLYNAYTHFYMTYFLAVVSGLPEETALKIAMATQYVDENDATKPDKAVALLPNSQLNKYHFTLDYGSGSHGDPNSDALTRFYDPDSDQLERLYQITDKDNLTKMWHEVNGDSMCPMPATIDNARYQFYGEYLHAYEDTFAHRDMNNMAYDKFSFNDNNVPSSTLGHVTITGMISSWLDSILGTHLDDGSWEAPDQTYNTEEFKVDASCKALVDPGAGTTTDLNFTSKSDCESQGGKYTAGSSWQYNELRTLRMEYEVFSQLQDDFASDIAQNGGKKATWEQLAGTADWDEDSVRLGGNPVLAKDDFKNAKDSDKLKNVLQQFNAAGNNAKYDVLNDWLKNNGYISNNMPHLAVTKNLGTAKEESEMAGSQDQSLQKAPTNRTEFLNWIPQETATISGVAQPGTSVPATSDSKHSTSDEFGVILPPKANNSGFNPVPSSSIFTNSASNAVTSSSATTTGFP